MAVDLHFGKERIQELRQRLGLTQAAFANTVGVAQPTVSQWESGERTPEGAAVLGRLLELEAGLPSQQEEATA